MPVSDDIHLVDGRYQRLDPSTGEYVHPGYKSESHRRRSQIVGELALLAMPLGYGALLARRVHLGIKGVRRINVGKFGGRYYDTTRRKFISKADYRSRFGLPRTTFEAVKLPHTVYKEAVKKAQRRFPRTFRVTRTVDFVRDPSGFLKKKYIPYYGFVTAVSGGYGIYRKFVRNYGSEDDGGSRPAFPQTAVLPGRLPGGLVNPNTKHKPTRSPSGSCPPGHRWSSASRTCVPLRRNRA